MMEWNGMEWNGMMEWNDGMESNDGIESINVKVFQFYDIYAKK
jgi:hypothetical protein